MLEPMIAHFHDFMINSLVTQVMESMVLGNVWFSQVSLWMSIDRDLKADGVAVKKPFGQLMARTFDSSRRN
ncbi:hypothetical protein KRP22_013583 [Phytophthora ramorum]|nr:hypothetical protein KRP22_11242 [Phytophthora ramorum]